MKLRLGLILLFLLAGCSKNEIPAPTPAKSETSSTKVDRAQVKIDPAHKSLISGVLTFDGKPPKPQPIDMSQDPACVMGKVPPNFGEGYAVNKGRLQNVYVYIK